MGHRHLSRRDVSGANRNEIETLCVMLNNIDYVRDQIGTILDEVEEKCR